MCLIVTWEHRESKHVLPSVDCRLPKKFTNGCLIGAERRRVYGRNNPHDSPLTVPGRACRTLACIAAFRRYSHQLIELIIGSDNLSWLALGTVNRRSGSDSRSQRRARR